MPWIYDKERPEIHATSTYNRPLKGTVFKNNYETRLAMIRKNLSVMDDKLLKLRTDRLKSKEPTYEEKVLLGVHKALSADAGAGKFKQQSASKARAAKAAAKKDMADMGIEARKSSPVKKSAGASRGGSLSKKFRETVSLG